MKPGEVGYLDGFTSAQWKDRAMLHGVMMLERLVTSVNELREAVDAVGERLANSMEGPS